MSSSKESFGFYTSSSGLLQLRLSNFRSMTMRQESPIMWNYAHPVSVAPDLLYLSFLDFWSLECLVIRLSGDSSVMRLTVLVTRLFALCRLWLTFPVTRVFVDLCDSGSLTRIGLCRLCGQSWKGWKQYPLGRQISLWNVWYEFVVFKNKK